MRVLLAGFACVAAVLQPAWASAAAPAAPAATVAAPLPSLDIPATVIRLSNGLTVIVHEDHKAPIVAVNIWYHVGSMNEPEGRTGFAHLFEHLMFGGKNGDQRGWFEKMEAVGATDLNGTTNEDRTNFFETVPVNALDMTLYLEAQRMGHLLDGFNEGLLTTQRGVVQNEKRQFENQPYTVSEEIIAKTVWPAAHPYSHTVIGEMTDLDAAKVGDVKDWFSRYYGPSNAVVVLAGDITPAEARTKVEQAFGAIPPGPPVRRQKVWVAKRTGRQFAAVQDRVAQPRLYKVWNTPGWGTADADRLELLGDVLDTGKNSRLYRRLVIADQLATTVQVGLDLREIAGAFVVEVTAKPGVALERIEAVVDEELARLLRDGPTAEELERVRTNRIAGRVRAAERIGGFGGKSDVLAASWSFGDDPQAWKASFERVRTATPAAVTAAGRAWLSDGAFALYVTPFPDLAPKTVAGAAASEPVPGPGKAAAFPAFRRAALKNGLKVVVVERHDLPTVDLTLVMDAGLASDAAARPGSAALTAALLSDGTAALDAPAFSDRLLALGARFSASTSRDSTYASMSALSARLDPALDLFADAVRRPAFRPEDVAREKALRVAAIQQAKRNPMQLASRLEPALVYGSRHAYGSLATEADVAALTPDALRAYHAAWIQPAGATLIVVGDTTLAALMPRLEARFGDWVPTHPPPKAIGPVEAPRSRVVYLIDKPGALQTVIAAGLPAPPRSNPDDIAIEAMNTSVGGAFTSRLNMNLREDKHWSYGAFSQVGAGRGPSLFLAMAPVQTDKTAESFAEFRRELTEINAARPLGREELTLAQGNLTRSLPGLWETSAGVTASLRDIAAFGLPDDYYATYAGRVDRLTTADVGRAAKTVVRPDEVTWLVVGDRDKVEPGLKSLGLEIRRLDADGKPAP